MSERDELAGIIADAARKSDAAHWPEAAAMAALATGYRKPRTITTAEELDALQMVVVRTSAGTIANIVNGRAYCFGYEASAPIGSLTLPVTVLYEPEPQP